MQTTLTCAKKSRMRAQHGFNCYLKVFRDLFRSQRRRIFKAALIFDDLRHIGKAFAALRPASAAAEHLRHRARVVRRGGEFPISQRITNANIHGGDGNPLWPVALAALWPQQLRPALKKMAQLIMIVNHMGGEKIA